MQLNEILNKIKSILTEPNKFFKNLKKEKGIETAFLYFLIVSVFSVVLGSIVGRVFQKYSYSMLSTLFGFSFPLPKYTPFIFIFGMFFAYIFGVISSFIIAGILHVWILIFGGKADYSKTYQLYVYSHTPSLALGWIPFVAFFAWIYGLVLLIIGTERIHSITRRRAILMYIVPIIILILLAMLVLAFVLTFFRANPDFMKMIPFQRS